MLIALLLNALSLGAAYALLALGFVVTLNATGAVNFAHGDMVMAGGFLAAVLAGALPVPGIVLLPVQLAVMAAAGVLLALAAYLPLRARPPETVFLSTIAAGIVLQNGATLLFGPEPRAVPPLLGGGTIPLGGFAVSRQGLAVLAVAALLVAALHALFAHTQAGRRMRAVAQDRETAAALGIGVDATVLGAFALGGALAGAAGLLLSNAFFVTPTQGTGYVLTAYAATVIGGWGSIPGAVAGALLIAAAQVLFPSLPVLLPGLTPASDLFSQTNATMLLDAAILGLLMVRPQGLFGEAARRVA